MKYKLQEETKKCRPGKEYQQSLVTAVLSGTDLCVRSILRLKESYRLFRVLYRQQPCELVIYSHVISETSWIPLVSNRLNISSIIYSTSNRCIWRLWRTFACSALRNSFFVNYNIVPNLLQTWKKFIKLPFSQSLAVYMMNAASFITGPGNTTLSPNRNSHDSFIFATENGTYTLSLWPF